MTVSDTGDGARLRRNVLLVVLGVAGVGVLGGVIGFVIASVRHHVHHHRGVPVLALAAILLVAALASAVIVAIMLVVMLRRPHYRAVMSLGYGQRWRVSRQLRRGRPVSAEDWAAAETMISTIRRQRWLIPLFGALAVVWLVDGLFGDAGQRWVHIGLSALYAFVAVPVMIWERRRMQRTFDRQAAERRLRADQ